MNEIRHRVGIKAPCQDVYEATFHPDKLESWWATTATGSTEVGSKIELEFPGYPNQVWELVELTANKRVHMKFLSGPEEWHGTELLFEFKEADGQVFVTLTHLTAKETPAEAFLYFCTKWPMFLVSLKEYLETGKGMPYPNDIKIQH